jgi:uncharacterized protein with gpF-like domain
MTGFAVISGHSANARESQSQQSRQPGWKIVQDDKGNHHGRDGWSASLADQVDPSQYFTDVEGLVMRSVQTGRDLGQLTKDLQEQFGVTRRRAAFVARDQNNEATASMTRTRQTSRGSRKRFGCIPAPASIRARHTSQ